MARQPNILLVHCHDLGQFLHCYGVETVHTPNLDAFSAEGVRFAHSYSTAPQCSPSRASIFTGRYPHSTGVMGLVHGDFGWDLYPEERHLGQFLKDAGYATAGVGIIHETRSGPTRCGLDEYSPESFANEATPVAAEYLKRFACDPARPFYLQVGFFEPHRLDSSDPDADYGFLGTRFGPDMELGVSVPGYLRDTEGTRAELAELQGAVRHVDEQFGRLMGALLHHNLLDNTLVIFTTDHGVALPRAKCTLHDPGIEVALILRLPSRAGWHGGLTVKPLISNIDYLPTILDLLGLPVPRNVQGRSFVPLLDREDYVTRDAIYSEFTYHQYYDPRRCIRTETHKLIVNFSSARAFMDPSQSWRPRSDTLVPVNNAHAFHPAAELYDLRTDPWELCNLVEDPDQTASREALRARLHHHLVETEDPILDGEVISPMHRKAVAFLEEGAV